MSELKLGISYQQKGAPTYGVACFLEDETLAGAYPNRQAAMAQAERWQTEYPDAPHIVVYLPAGEAA